MTICIAALTTHENKQCIVFATDHMVSLNMHEGFLGGFEHTFLKYKQIDNNSVAMLAGNPLLFNDLINDIDVGVAHGDKVEMIYKNFLRKRKEVIKKEILDPHGLTKKFIIESLQEDIKNPIMGAILQKIFEFQLKTTMMVVGFEKRKGLISVIDETGFQDWTEFHFHAIGSGSLQAMNTLMFQHHSINEDLLSTVYNVYKAKRNAEVAMGVGKETELLIFEPKKLIKIEEHNLNILDEIYAAGLDFGKKIKT